MGIRSEKKFKYSLFGVSVLLGAMLTIQMTSSKNSDANFVGADVITVKNALAYESQHHEQLIEQLYKMEKKLNEYKTAPNDQEKVLARMKEELEKSKVEAGLTTLEGNGIRIEIKDNPYYSSFVDKDPRDKLFYVWDFELVYLINILQSNGAQALSINNQRIVTTTGIRQVGQSFDPGNPNLVIRPGTMQVNFNAISMPYVIDAVGDIDKMKGALSTYFGKEYFIPKAKDFIVTEYKGSDKLKLPPYLGNPNFQHANEDKAEGAIKP